jgi:hypothetical protein
VNPATPIGVLVLSAATYAALLLPVFAWRRWGSPLPARRRTPAARRASSMGRDELAAFHSEAPAFDQAVAVGADAYGHTGIAADGEEED